MCVAGRSTNAVDAMPMGVIHKVRAPESVLAQVRLPLHADKEKPHNSLLFSDYQSVEMVSRSSTDDSAQISDTYNNVTQNFFTHYRVLMSLTCNLFTHLQSLDNINFFLLSWSLLFQNLI